MNLQLFSFIDSEVSSYPEGVISRINDLKDVSIPYVLYSGGVFSGIMNLITTVSIAHNFKGYSFSERYCFKDPEIAYNEFIAWYKRGFNDQRPVGWIACRNVSSQDLRDSMERYHSKNYGQEVLSVYLDLSKNNSGFIPYEMILDHMMPEDEDENDILHKISYLRETGQIS